MFLSHKDTWYGLIHVSILPQVYYIYRQISNIRHTTSQNIPKCFSSCLTVLSAQSIEARCSVDNEDVVGAAPTADVPTTSEWSTILLPTTVCFISSLTVSDSKITNINSVLWNTRIDMFANQTSTLLFPWVHVDGWVPAHFAPTSVS